MANPTTAESLLIQQAQNGDLESFNQLVLEYQDLLYSITYRIMGTRTAAEDATQDAFITAYRKLASYRGGKFSAWLARIATNTCYDELRKQKRRPASYLDDLTPEDSDDEPPIPSNTISPEAMAERQDLSRAIQDCIQSLSDDQRTVLVLSDVQGMSYQEVADCVESRLGTVKSRLSRARLAVRDCLQAFQELLPTEYRLGNNE